MTLHEQPTCRVSMDGFVAGSDQTYDELEARPARSKALELVARIDSGAPLGRGRAGPGWAARSRPSCPAVPYGDGPRRTATAPSAAE